MHFQRPRIIFLGNKLTVREEAKGNERRWLWGSLYLCWYRDGYKQFRGRNTRGSIVWIVWSMLVFAEHFNREPRVKRVLSCGINDRNKWEVSLKRRDIIIYIGIYPLPIYPFYFNLVTYLVIVHLPLFSSSSLSFRTLFPPFIWEDCT